ncbi:hypothetical protein CABS01_08971 [Colletotrichum abscissum]|uniref:Uncharacterized protein n=1 Tax=Colletotrichum abscissum TaxID=1671311 RepID=A0A9P9X4K4_9PEZI|nr:uncharacterized protein CABS01_08971 [Colletotrichum abscissum]KAI3536145.1 hypothetical protein CABS02_12640 [Colletotrichum abscissum]KAK1503582.1 hypothetical protein CABS01_08971 [Colletotrichum abscissum]
MLRNAVSLLLTRPVRHPPSRASSDSPPTQRLRHCENKSKLWDMSIPFRHTSRHQMSTVLAELEPQLRNFLEGRELIRNTDPNPILPAEPTSEFSLAASLCLATSSRLPPCREEALPRPFTGGTRLSSCTLRFFSGAEPAVDPNSVRLCLQLALCGNLLPDGCLQHYDCFAVSIV